MIVFGICLNRLQSVECPTSGVDIEVFHISLYM